MKRIIDHEDFAVASPGWEAALRNADPRFLWEALILDANAEYAALWTDRERAIAAGAIAETYAPSRTTTLRPEGWPDAARGAGLLGCRGIVGFIVISMYLPLFKVYDQIR